MYKLASACRSSERALLDAALCPHLEPGSVVEDPPLLSSTNGNLEVVFSYKTSVDSNGNPTFCYITPQNQQSPTLYLKVGDTLVVHLKNEVPASVDITDYGVQGQLPRNFSICQDSADSINDGSTNFHFHGMEVTPICGGDQVQLFYNLDISKS